MATAPSPVPDMTPAELREWDNMSDQEKAGYLLYRQGRMDADRRRKRAVQKAKYAKDWNNKEPATEKRRYINRAVAAAPQNANAAQASGSAVAGPAAAQNSAVAGSAPVQNTADAGQDTAGANPGPRLRFKPLRKPPSDAPVTRSASQNSTDPDYSYEPSSTEEQNPGIVLPPPEGQRWCWVKTLYDTKMKEKTDFRCIVTLYVLVDVNGTIRDRVVMKKVKCEGPHQLKKLSAEIDKILSLPAECTSLVKLRARNNEKKNSLFFRVYTDYCPHLDLADLIVRYQNYEYGQIPEPFIWLVFLALAEAIYAYNTGNCATAAEESDAGLTRRSNDDWTNKYLIHRDIKPRNIFLGTPIPPYTAYPNPIIADYDIAIEIPTHNDGTPAEDMRKYKVDTTQCGGTEGWMPPEVMEPALDHEVSSKVDVWGAGMVIWNLMYAGIGRTNKGKDRNSRLRNVVRKHFFKFEDGDTYPTGERHVDCDAVYSRNLHDLVRRCLKTDPEARPGFFELRKRVKREMLRVERSLGLSETNRHDPPAHLQLHYVPDEFAVNQEATIPKKRKLGPSEVNRRVQPRRG